MQCLLHDLLRLPIADRLLIIEQTISSGLTEGEERFRQIQKQLNTCMHNKVTGSTSVSTKKQTTHNTSKNSNAYEIQLPRKPSN